MRKTARKGAMLHWKKAHQQLASVSVVGLLMLSLFSVLLIPNEGDGVTGYVTNEGNSVVLIYKKYDYTSRVQSSPTAVQIKLNVNSNGVYSVQSVEVGRYTSSNGFSKESLAPEYVLGSGNLEKITSQPNFAGVLESMKTIANSQNNPESFEPFFIEGKDSFGKPYPVLSYRDIIGPNANQLLAQKGIVDTPDAQPMLAGTMPNTAVASSGSPNTVSPSQTQEPTTVEVPFTTGVLFWSTNYKATINKDTGVLTVTKDGTVIPYSDLPNNAIENMATTFKEKGLDSYIPSQVTPSTTVVVEATQGTRIESGAAVSGTNGVSTETSPKLIFTLPSPNPAYGPKVVTVYNDGTIAVFDEKTEEKEATFFGRPISDNLDKLFDEYRQLLPENFEGTITTEVPGKIESYVIITNVITSKNAGDLLEGLIPRPVESLSEPTAAISNTPTAQSTTYAGETNNGIGKRDYSVAVEMTEGKITKLTVTENCLLACWLLDSASSGTVKSTYTNISKFVEDCGANCGEIKVVDGNGVSKTINGLIDSQTAPLETTIASTSDSATSGRGLCSID